MWVAAIGGPEFLYKWSGSKQVIRFCGQIQIIYMNFGADPKFSCEF